MFSQWGLEGDAPCPCSRASPPHLSMMTRCTPQRATPCRVLPNMRAVKRFSELYTCEILIGGRHPDKRRLLRPQLVPTAREKKMLSSSDKKGKRATRKTKTPAPSRALPLVQSPDCVKHTHTKEEKAFPQRPLTHRPDPGQGAVSLQVSCRGPPRFIVHL